jgi:hypothetical protein
MRDYVTAAPSTPANTPNVVFTCSLLLLNTTALSQGATAGGVVVSVTQIPILAVVFLAGIYSTFKIPSLVGDIFSGAANAGTGVQQAVSGAVAAAIF